MTLPNGTAVLSIRRRCGRSRGDKVAVSCRAGQPGPRVPALLERHAPEGPEPLQHLGRLPAAGCCDLTTRRRLRRLPPLKGIRFRGGTGSCVIDRLRHQDRRAPLSRNSPAWCRDETSASVVVAAAPSAEWGRARPVLLRAVAAYAAAEES